MEDMETWFNHGYKNADGSERDHCCGCWVIRAHTIANVEAVCNECGEVRDLMPVLDGSH